MVDSIQSVNHTSRLSKSFSVATKTDKGPSTSESQTSRATKNIEYGTAAIDRKSVEQEVDKINKMVEAADIQNLTFKLHEESDTLYAQMIDPRTQEVLKTFPPEYMLELSAKMKDLVGVFIDQKI